MFIVWRKKILSTDRKTELFVEYSNAPAGHVVKLGRRKEDLSQRPAWTPLWCDHKGEERLAWTPLLMHAERINGKPRQRLLHRFPTIRSCCIDAPFIRAAWWYAVEEQIRVFEEEDLGIARQLIVRDKKIILAKLREVVPAPSSRAAHEFASYRLRREAAQHSRVEERDEPLDRQTKEQALHEVERRAKAEAERRAQEAQQRAQARRQAQEAARRQAEEQAQQEREVQRAWNEFVQERQRAGFNGFNGGLDCWGILGLPHYASLEQIKKNYRGLMLKHHPDRGGDTEVCKRINAAYEQAQAFWGVGR